MALLPRPAGTRLPSMEVLVARGRARITAELTDEQLELVEYGIKLGACAALAAYSDALTAARRYPRTR